MAMPAAAARSVRASQSLCSSLALIAVPLVGTAILGHLGNYIGLYSMVALGLVLLTGVGGSDVVRTGGVRRHRRLCDRLSHHALRCVTLAGVACGPCDLPSWSRSRWGRSRCGCGTLPAARDDRLGHQHRTSCSATSSALGGHTGMTGIPSLAIGRFRSRGASVVTSRSSGASRSAACGRPRNLLDSRLGRALRASKGGAPMAQAFGVEPAAVKIVAFVYAALLAAHLGLALCPPAALRQSDAVRHPGRASNTCSWRSSAAPGACGARSSARR